MKPEYMQLQSTKNLIHLHSGGEKVEAKQELKAPRVHIATESTCIACE